MQLPAAARARQHGELNQATLGQRSAATLLLGGASVARPKFSAQFNPFPRDWLGEVIPHNFQQTEVTFGIVEKNAYHFVSAIEPDVDVYFSNQILMAGQFRVLRILRLFEHN